MFLFIPQLLIVLSLAGIILIVLRRTPELRFPMPVLLRDFENFTIKWLRILSQKLWHFVLEVKELSRKTQPLGFLPKHLSKLHLPRPKLKLPSFKSAAPGTAEFFIKQGEKLLEQGEHADAEQHFIKAIKKDPHNEQAFAYLGKLYLAQNKTKESIETFRFLIKHYPDKGHYHASLGQAYHNHKQYDKAISAHERAIDLEPENSRRYIDLGMTLEAKKHLEEAILNYRKAVDLDAENTQAVIILSEALVKKGGRDEAEILLEKVLMIEPTNTLAREKLMQLKYQTNN
ncbi:MAG: hypothetical protein A2751_05625 [Candidatus Doudnabacteria bacterium RIFCSPHIGHO2_01_FULL_46_14]|uniref:Uncharacterized protein n=1 Tax=Candidatus Doudnabacteria bacterium RIFCSPHIGHO2_01_FULL_46_14 TaxID=1817824 RepID=A0A1F5NNJ1_9BACT|nr:MAG: hypothetical protein A2751_05625 [Candidatus Doudnabacteria bacterium RIFCSPHIGHO2_01_FULL_46_14]